MATAAEVAKLAERPEAQRQTTEFRAARPQIVGPDTPQSPYPILLSGPVQQGFGRGGKELGCPTANLPDDSITPMSSVCEPGVYYGYAQVLPPKDANWDEKHCIVHPMVMSLGWNPFYKNERLTAEIHVMHEFDADFYGYDLKAVVLGYIRPELDYTSREALIEDIETDKRVALNSLARPSYQEYSKAI
ncbi:riboflavin kinase [Roridomyces roridus]|uniref:Riboflavin kinase n=1 Tax=Roridomyces roridus TaxID=1738132 RepID=A0AAD7C4A9_9AGAR|nr:riboflavin kinase [Roridomyces roridus]